MTKKPAKKSTATRSTAKRLKLPPTTKLQHGRAAKMAEPFIDEIQKAVDEQTEVDFGLKPQHPKRAAEFRRRVAEMALMKKGRKRG